MKEENKQNIIIVECRSTGINFIEDIVNRGYHPVILNPRYGESEEGEQYAQMTKDEYKHIKYPYDYIEEEETYEKTLETVKKWNPLLVLPGNERGVILASKLSSDLNLICNDIKNLPAMTLKNEMQNRISEKGLRSIRGKVVKSVEEAIEFYDKEDLKKVVLKPIISAGSASVRFCSDKEEMINSLKDLFNKYNVFGEELEEILVQEYINGDEYIINTVSCKGQHRVTLVWKYKKFRTEEGAILYDTCETVNELNLGEAKMVEYAYEVADAIGIEYGPIHGEYMIDEKGPVLIEVNCRPCGGHMSARFLDKISGQHETDSILDAYLKPERFQEQLKQRYQLYSYGALKFLSVPRDMVARSAPLKKIGLKLKSYFEISMADLDEIDKKTYFKTDDVDSTCGIVYLAHENYAEIQDNIEYLRIIEKRAFPLVLSEENEKEGPKEINLNKFKEMLKKNEKHGTGLFISDQFIDDIDIMQIHPNDLESVDSEFDFTVINFNQSLIEKNTDDTVQILLNCFKTVKTGGIIVIPKSTYHLFNSGREGVEALIRLAGLKIELPPYTLKDTIIASRR